MPRAKIDYSQSHMVLLAGIGNLKSYSTDIIADFSEIYKIQYARFSSAMDNKSRIKLAETIKKLSSIRVKVVNRCRIYLLSDYDHLRFVMYNPDACVVQHMKTCLNLSYNCLPEKVPISCMTTLFICEGISEPYYCDISTVDAMDLLIAFQKENLINTGAFRDFWYGNPRRKAKAEQQLLNKPTS